MNIEQKNSWWLRNGHWLLPGAVAVIAILLMLLPAYWIGSLPVYTGRIEQSEKQRKGIRRGTAKNAKKSVDGRSPNRFLS